MQIYKGKSVFGGIAIGKISVYKKDEQLVKRVKIEDADAEMERYTAARNIAAAQLQKLYDKALKEVGEANAAIFEVHQMMLEDEDYNESAEINGCLHAEIVLVYNLCRNVLSETVNDTVHQSILAEQLYPARFTVQHGELLGKEL